MEEEEVTTLKSMSKNTYLLEEAGGPGNDVTVLILSSHSLHLFNKICGKWHHAWVSVVTFVCGPQRLQWKPIWLWLQPALFPPPTPTAPSPPVVQLAAGRQPAVRRSSTCAGIINHSHQWQTNRAWPIHEYFEDEAERAARLCPKARCHRH